MLTKITQSFPEHEESVLSNPQKLDKTEVRFVLLLYVKYTAISHTLYTGVRMRYIKHVYREILIEK